MIRILRIWRFFVELFSRRESGTTLACFRIALGLVTLYSLLSIAAAGLLDVLWVDRFYGGYRNLPSGGWLIDMLGGTTSAVVHGVHAVALGATVLVTIGIGGRPVTFIALQSYLALISINADTVGGYDIMITNALWLLVLGEPMATLSLRCRRKTGAWTSDTQIAAWPRYLLVFQLIVVYTATGLYKLSPEWTPGGSFPALFQVYQDPTWRRFNMDFTAWIFPLTQIATAITWFFETGAWTMLLVFYFRYTKDRDGRLRALLNRFDLRIPFTALGLCLHMGILFTLNVGPFSWVSMSYYLCMWHPDELQHAAAVLYRRIRQKRDLKP